MKIIWYGVQPTELFAVWGYFLPFYPLTTLKTKILEKWKKFMEIWSFYTCVSKMKIICMVPKIWVAMVNFLFILGLFCPFTTQEIKIKKQKKNKKNERKVLRYYHFTHVCHKLRSCDVRFLRYAVWQSECFITLGHFLPFYSTNNPKNEKKTPGDIIILH